MWHHKVETKWCCFGEGKMQFELEEMTTMVISGKINKGLVSFGDMNCNVDNKDNALNVNKLSLAVVTCANSILKIASIYYRKQVIK